MSVALILAALTVVLVLLGSRPWDHHAPHEGPQTLPSAPHGHEGQVMRPPAA